MNKKSLNTVLTLFLIACILFVLHRWSLSQTVEGFAAPSASQLVLRGIDLNFNYKVGLNQTSIFGPKDLPQATLDAVGKAYDKFRLYKDMLERPADFIRVDPITHIPYMINQSKYDGRTFCLKQYEIKTDQYQRRSLGFKADWQTSSNKDVCNIQVTPQVLGTLPLAVRNKFIDYIYNEQLAVTVTKEETIAANAISGLNARDMAKGSFSPELLALRQQQKQQAYNDLKAAAQDSIEKIAKKAGTTSAKLVGSAAARQTAKGVAQAMQAATPFGLASAAIKAGVGPLLSAVAGNISKAIADSEGHECPTGYVEGGTITNDNDVFTAVNDFFPNPLTDSINSALNSISCVRYNSDGTAQTALRRRCIPNVLKSPPDLCFGPLPVKMTAVEPTASTDPKACEADKDITKKLQLISDWLLDKTMTTKESATFMVVNRFTYVCNAADVCIECIFNAGQFYKTKDDYNKYKQYNGSPDNYRARFYFKKDGCTYTVLGYNSTKLDFMDQYDCGSPLEYIPTKNVKQSLFDYAISKNEADPLKYALDNQSNTTLLNQIKKEEEDRLKQELAVKKEREDLYAVLNPSKNTRTAAYLDPIALPELRERRDIITKYKLDTSDTRNIFISIADLRQKGKDEDEKVSLIAFLNPSNDIQLGAIYKNLSLADLRARKTEKPERDQLLLILNPTKDSATQISLERLSTPELRVKKSEKDNRDMILGYLNPQKDAAIAAQLTPLDTNELNRRYWDRKAKEPLFAYFNPSNVPAVLAYLDKFSVDELKQRKDLIGILKPKNLDEIQSYNALDLETLKKKADEIMGPRKDAYTYFNPKNDSYIKSFLDNLTTADLNDRKTLVPQIKKSTDISTRQFYIQPGVTMDDIKYQVALDALPTPNDCNKPWRQRKNCPSTFRY